MKKLLTLILTLSLLLTLAACGGGSKETAAMAAPKEEAAAMDMAANGAALTGAESGASTAVPEGRKWIITMYLHAETEDMDAMTLSLDNEISAAGGYVETKNIWHGSSRNEQRLRNANLIIRVPADKADSFVQDVGEFSNIISQEKQLEDITLTYVATESRMKALQTEEVRLLELLGQAKNMEDLLAIEARLSEVRTELESVTTQMRYFDNQVDYATIHLSIQEVRKYTPVEEPSLWQRISRGFTDNLERLGDGALDLLVFLLAGSPYLVTYGILALVLVLLVKRGRKFAAKKKAEKKGPQE